MILFLSDGKNVDTESFHSIYQLMIEGSATPNIQEINSIIADEPVLLENPNAELFATYFYYTQQEAISNLGDTQYLHEMLMDFFDAVQRNQALYAEILMLKQYIKEEPTNVVGTGHIAGANNDPFVGKKKKREE